MDKFYRIPIPIDHTATTKPRRTAKRKRKARGMVTAWALTRKLTGDYIVNASFQQLHVYRTLKDAKAQRLRHCNIHLIRIVKLSLPAPAVKVRKG